MKIEDIRFDMPKEPVDEKDFDVEKWRKENPMDYLKAMYIISTATNAIVKNEIFKTIYQVTRLHIPDTLFKYYSLTDDIALNEQKLETLERKKIFMSDARCLNDPFDNKGFFYKSDELKKYKRLKPHNGKLIDDFSSFAKISALTSNRFNSMPMWAHYGNNHAGYCVSYDMKSNMELSSCTFPVQYTDQRIDITSLMIQQVEKINCEIKVQSAKGIKQILLDDLSLVFLASLFCNIKHISWSYENEFRCTIGAIAEGMSYVTAMPKEIYIGMKCSSDNTNRIIKIGQQLEIPVSKTAFDEWDSEFNLLPMRI